ncbi:unnamed protein product [Boreogadus saida]
MITRRRGSIKRHEVQSPEFEVTDAVETVDDLPCLHDEDDGTGLELDELFDDLKWTGDKDTTSSLFDVGLNDWGLYNMKDDDSMFEASTSPSPERTPFEARSKKSENQAGSMVNKNAIAARMNRLKKKEYVNDLEKKVGSLSTENHKLKQDNCGLNKRVEELEDETRKRIKVEEKETSGGICLHVDKNHVSVEFCTKCAENASATLKIFLLGNG